VPHPAWQCHLEPKDEVTVPDFPTTLLQLHDRHVERFNTAITEDRNDLVDARTAEFADVALTTLLGTETHAR